MEVDLVTKCVFHNK